MDCKLIDREKGKVFLPNNKESILFQNVFSIVGNMDKALDVYFVTETPEFKTYNYGLIAENRANNSIVKNAIDIGNNLKELFSENDSIRIEYSENEKGQIVLNDLETDNTTAVPEIIAFLDRFLKSFPNKEVTVSPQISNTAFYQNFGFETIDGVLTKRSEVNNLYPKGYDINGEPSLKQLLNFINLTGTTSTKKIDVIKTMQSLGLTDSKDLLNSLLKAEKEGIFLFNKKSLESTGIFTNFEISKIMKEKPRQDAIKDLVKYLRLNEEIIIDEIGTENGAELLPTAKISPEYVVPQQSALSQIIGGIVEVKKVTNSNVETVKTISDDINLQLSENIAFIKRISDDNSWQVLSSQIKTLLKSVEDNALENGIDLTGLSDSYDRLSRQSIVEILDATEYSILGEVHPDSLDILLQDSLGQGEQVAPFELQEGQVYLNNPMDEQVAYEDMGMIKITDNLYQTVKDESLISLINKNSIKRGISAEQVERNVNDSYDRSIDDVEIAKKIYLLKDNMNLVGFKKYLLNSDKINNAIFDNTFFTDGSFEQMFGRWLMKNSNTLFTIDERGITFTDSGRALEAYQTLPKYLQESLNEYSKISKYFDIPVINEETVLETGEIWVERSKVVADPYSVSEYKGAYSFAGNSLIVRDYVDNFLRIGDRVYELNSEIGNLSVFNELLPSNDNFIPLEINKPENSLNLAEYNALQTMNSTIKQVKSIPEAELEKLNEEHYKC